MHSPLPICFQWGDLVKYKEGLEPDFAKERLDGLDASLANLAGRPIGPRIGTHAPDIFKRRIQGMNQLVPAADARTRILYGACLRKLFYRTVVLVSVISPGQSYDCGFQPAEPGMDQRTHRSIPAAVYFQTF